MHDPSSTLSCAKDGLRFGPSGPTSGHHWLIAACYLGTVFERLGLYIQIHLGYFSNQNIRHINTSCIVTCKHTVQASPIFFTHIDIFLKILLCSISDFHPLSLHRSTGMWLFFILRLTPEHEIMFLILSTRVWSPHARESMLGFIKQIWGTFNAHSHRQPGHGPKLPPHGSVWAWWGQHTSKLVHFLCCYRVMAKLHIAYKPSGFLCVVS